MLNTTLRYLLIVCLLVTGKPARAEEKYLFDKSKTSLSFSVSRFGFFETRGKFRDYDGSFIFSIQNPDRDAVAITLYTSGIDVGDEGRNEQLRGPDFFDAARFPSMQFVSTSVKLAGKDNAKIMGNLTLLGVTKPVTFDAHFTERDFDAKTGEYVVSFTASTVIRRSDFGMTYLIPIVGDKVHLQVEAKGIEKKP